MFTNSNKSNNLDTKSNTARFREFESHLGYYALVSKRSKEYVNVDSNSNPG